MTDRPWETTGEMEATVIWPEPGRVELLVGDAVITLTAQQADDLGRLLGTASEQSGATASQSPSAEPGPTARLEQAEARVQQLEAALRSLIAAVDEYPGAYPDREAEIAALEPARTVLADRPPQETP